MASPDNEVRTTGCGQGVLGRSLWSPSAPNGLDVSSGGGTLVRVVGRPMPHFIDAQETTSTCCSEVVVDGRPGEFDTQHSTPPASHCSRWGRTEQKRGGTSC